MLDFKKIQRASEKPDIFSGGSIYDVNVNDGYVRIPIG